MSQVGSGEAIVVESAAAGSARRMKVVLLTLAALAVIAVAYASTLRLYYDDGTPREAIYTPGGGGTANRIDLTATILSVDPMRDTMTLRLTLVPIGTYTSDNGRSPSRDLRLLVNSVSGGTDRAFPKGKHLSPTEVTLDLLGNVSDYPFDSYTSPLDLDLFEAAPERPVPIRVNFQSQLHGIDVTSSLDRSSADGDVTLNLSVTRSRATVGFALFMMAAMAAAAAVVVLMVGLIIAQKRRLDPPFFAWIGAMLFALPAIRNSLPGTPTVGTLSDFLVFFWALGLVIASLVALAVTWVARPAR